MAVVLEPFQDRVLVNLLPDKFLEQPALLLSLVMTVSQGELGFRCHVVHIVCTRIVVVQHVKRRSTVLRPLSRLHVSPTIGFFGHFGNDLPHFLLVQLKRLGIVRSTTDHLFSTACVPIQRVIAFRQPHSHG